MNFTVTVSLATSKHKTGMSVVGFERMVLNSLRLTWTGLLSQAPAAVIAFSSAIMHLVPLKWSYCDSSLTVFGSA
jgi:hypothetical protein